MSNGFSGSNAPIHEWFGLSYAGYLVIPRSVLQSLPGETQLDLIDILDEANKIFGWSKTADGYRVQPVDEKGKFTEDSLGDYERGRRRLIPQEG